MKTAIRNMAALMFVALPLGLLLGGAIVALFPPSWAVDMTHSLGAGDLGLPVSDPARSCVVGGRTPSGSSTYFSEPIAAEVDCAFQHRRGDAPASTTHEPLGPSVVPQKSYGQ